MQKQNPQTKEEARQYAVDWQNWASEQALSYQELAEWQAEFQAIGNQFGLLEEFEDYTTTGSSGNVS